MRVVIGEDETLLREGLRLLLTDLGLDVVALTATADDLPCLVAEHDADLVVTDIRMPPQHRDDGLRAALAVRTARPGQPVIVLSQHVQRRYALSLLGSGEGGVGYLLKQRVADVVRFHEDLLTVAGGGTVIDPEVVGPVLTGAATADPALRALTARQLQVVDLLAQGRSNTAIAAALGVTERAVKQHVANIYDAMALPEHPDDHRRVLAVLRYLGS